MKFNMEWRYFSGRTEQGVHFHYVEFRKDKKDFRHWSVDGKFYEDERGMGDALMVHTPQFEYWFRPATAPIEHSIPGKEYYSWPKLVDGKVEAWFDHAKMNEVGSNWDWIGLNLDCGMTIMAYYKEDYRYCDLTFNSKTIEVKFILDGQHFVIPELGMYLILDDSQLNPPTTRDIVYKPKYGRRYSEWCFDVISKGGIIGRGIREKTYKT